MALIDDMKLILRVSNNAYDIEVQMCIDSAIADMKRVGIREEVISSDNPLVRQAIACYCKANFGFDNEEAGRFTQSYIQTVTDLLHSDANIASYEEPNEQV